MRRGKQQRKLRTGMSYEKFKKFFEELHRKNKFPDNSVAEAVSRWWAEIDNPAFDSRYLELVASTMDGILEDETVSISSTYLKELPSLGGEFETMDDLSFISKNGNETMTELPCTENGEPESYSGPVALFRARSRSFLATTMQSLMTGSASSGSKKTVIDWVEELEHGSDGRKTLPSSYQVGLGKGDEEEVDGCMVNSGLC